jgi:hypothetical protein
VVLRDDRQLVQGEDHQKGRIVLVPHGGAHVHRAAGRGAKHGELLRGVADSAKEIDVILCSGVVH